MKNIILLLLISICLFSCRRNQVSTNIFQGKSFKLEGNKMVLIPSSLDNFVLLHRENSSGGIFTTLHASISNIAISFIKISTSQFKATGGVWTGSLRSGPFESIIKDDDILISITEKNKSFKIKGTVRLRKKISEITKVESLNNDIDNSSLIYINRTLYLKD